MQQSEDILLDIVKCKHDDPTGFNNWIATHPGIEIIGPPNLLHISHEPHFVHIYVWYRHRPIRRMANDADKMSMEHYLHDEPKPGDVTIAQLPGEVLRDESGNVIIHDTDGEPMLTPKKLTPTASVKR